MNLKKMSGTRFLLILAPILCSARSANAQLVERPLIGGRHAVVNARCDCRQGKTNDVVLHQW
jgi:hypothetical protein